VVEVPSGGVLRAIIGDGRSMELLRLAIEVASVIVDLDEAGRFVGRSSFLSAKVDDLGGAPVAKEWWESCC
jgi:hypothetical protein